MSGLGTSSKVLRNLGNLYIITGTITVTTNVWTLTSNDGNLALTDIGAGNVSVTYDAFLTAPTVLVSPLKATHEAAVIKPVLVESVSTTVAEFVCHSIDDTGAGTTDITTADPDNGDGFTFAIIGVRNS